MNLQTRYLGLSLAHPVIASASPLSATFDGIRRLEDSGAAAIVTASIYEEEIEAEAAALDAFATIGAESHPEVTRYAPLPGYPGALAARLELIRRACDSVSVPLIASLNGITREGWTGIAADLQAAGAAAIELDLFHLPVDPSESSADVEARLIETVRGVCAAVDIPVTVKLFPQFTAPAHLAGALAGAGASGIVLFNRGYEPDIDLAALDFRSGLSLSTAADIRQPVMWIALLAGKTSLSLAGGRGVEGPDEVIKYLLAGADAVQTASALLRHGAGHLRRLVEGLADWLEAHGADSLGEIRGRVRAAGFADPETRFRGGYRQTLLHGYPLSFSPR
ncbi:MAG TPA: dihydroorotate dehydrogenase-like protein [Stellaceae bacterium]|nr:dihydroorotate dehydrogenase-like protein [Stellaceae bacterium]